MVHQLARNWWLLALRGVLAMLFGIMAILWPLMAFTVLAIFFGAYFLVDGVFALVAAFLGRGSEPWWALLLEGLVGIIIGGLLLINPGFADEVLLIVIACWFIVTGIFEIVAAIMLRKAIVGEFWLVLSGILSVVFGVLALIRPVVAAITIAWLIGIYSIFFGAMLIALSMRLRRFHHETPPAVT